MGGGNFITQSAPTNFHTFFSRKILTPDDDISNYREVTARERTTLEESDAAWVRPPQSFIDHWNEACIIYSWNGAISRPTYKYGEYNESTGYFELNGLTDITYKQAIAIIRADIPRITSYPMVSCRSGLNMHFGWIRTNLPPQIKVNSWGDAFFGSPIEVINYGPCVQQGFGIYACTDLRTILGTIQLKTGAAIGGGCTRLRDVHVSAAAAVTFTCDSPVLSLESVDYFVSNSVSGATLATTKAVYAKLTGDTSNAAVTELSPDELAQWLAVAAKAVERGITIAHI